MSKYIDGKGRNVGYILHTLADMVMLLAEYIENMNKTRYDWNYDELIEQEKRIREELSDLKSALRKEDNENL